MEAQVKKCNSLRRGKPSFAKSKTLKSTDPKALKRNFLVTTQLAYAAKAAGCLLSCLLVCLLACLLACLLVSNFSFSAKSGDLCPEALNIKQICKDSPQRMCGLAAIFFALLPLLDANLDRQIFAKVMRWAQLSRPSLWVDGYTTASVPQQTSLTTGHVAACEQRLPVSTCEQATRSASIPQAQVNSCNPLLKHYFC